MNNKLFSSFSWAFAERISVQLASFVVSIVLARLLDPSVYGTLALANVFIAIVNAVTHTGFGTALIRKKEATNVDFSSTLYFSVGVGAIAYAVLFFAAPLIADFFDNQELIWVIRVVSISVVTASANTVQRAYISRKMQFHLFFYSGIIDSILSAALGIWMAYMGFGVWALVAQGLSRGILNIILLSFMSDWRPKLVFSLQSIKEVYGFGWKVIVSAMIDSLYDQIRSLVIGKKYTSSDLAYYDKGLQFPNLLVVNIDNTIAQVLVSAIAKLQDDLTSLREAVRKSMRMSSSIMFPLLIGMAVCAEPIVRLFLTDKWLPCVPYMQCLCIALMIKPVLTAQLQGFLALGRSDVTLKIKVAQKIVGVGILAVTVCVGASPLLIAFGEVISYLSFSVILAIPSKRILGTSYKNQIMDILPQLCAALTMGVAVYALGSILSVSLPVVLVVQVLVGASVYVVLGLAFRIPGILGLFDVFKSVLRRGN